MLASGSMAGLIGLNVGELSAGDWVSECGPWSLSDLHPNLGRLDLVGMDGFHYFSMQRELVTVLSSSCITTRGQLVRSRYHTWRLRGIN